jgi:hypothetical protein
MLFYARPAAGDADAPTLWLRLRAGLPVGSSVESPFIAP